jgi:hypothetical protein
MSETTWCRVLVDGETMALIRLPMSVDSLGGIKDAWPGSVLTGSKSLGECLVDMGAEIITVDVSGNPIDVRLVFRFQRGSGSPVPVRVFRKHDVRPEYCSVCDRHISLHHGETEYRCDPGEEDES